MEESGCWEREALLVAMKDYAGGKEFMLGR
jgi:hypothetical protein